MAGDEFQEGRAPNHHSGRNLPFRRNAPAVIIHRLRGEYEIDAKLWEGPRYKSARGNRLGPLTCCAAAASAAVQRDTDRRCQSSTAASDGDGRDAGAS